MKRQRAVPVAAGLLITAVVMGAAIATFGPAPFNRLLSSPAAVQPAGSAATPTILMVNSYQSPLAAVLPTTTLRLGQTRSIQALYAAAGVQVVMGPTAPLASAKDHVSKAEILALRTTLRSSLPASTVVGLVLPHSDDPTLAGLAFEDNRDGFAVFTNALGSGEWRLRTAAHEIGHVLNLFHGDSDGDVDCCKGAFGGAQSGTSIMTIPGCVEANTWDFVLSQGEADHLKNHPRTFVVPGTPFGTCIPQHQDACAS